jgi:dipeptide/tripeptide permease
MTDATNETIKEAAIPSPTFLDTMKSFTRTFWCSNSIELLERWAYYGVRGGIAVYMVSALTVGGLQFTHIQKANIFFWWAMFQSLLPTFTGGYADRYGYKKTVAIAVSLAVLGYINMAFQTSYWPFFTACMMVATGTALFKPGIQGILANSTTPQNATMGWSFFYMVVNIGGFTGPLIAGYLRLMSWKYVFITSAIIHACNLLLLFTFKEPESERKASSQANAKKGFIAGIADFAGIFASSIKNLLEPRLLIFLIVFSGFWLMFMQLFDLLPNFITDWVDTSQIVVFFGEIFNKPEWIAYGATYKQIPAEWLINLDAGAIILLMLPIGWTFGRLKPVSGMVLGIVIATAGLVASGLTMSPWWCMLGILIFAIGEMISSPRKSEYLAMLAPPGKKGLYMGYVNFPQGIGWMIGSKLAGPIYQYQGDKTTLARDYLITKLNMTKETVEALPPEKVMDTLTSALQLQSTRETTQFLFQTYHPERIWWIFAAIGIASMLGMLAYNIIVERKRQAPVK